jgi:glucose/arabinose dehydrogenase
VTVPAGMNSGPFDADRTLNVPDGFQIAVFARVPNARFMAVTPDGNLLVSQPQNGSIALVKPDGSTSTFASGMNSPHDMVFHTIDSTTYLYVSETSQVSRAVYTNGDTSLKSPEVVVPNLPTGGNHPLKNIALDSQHKLYVALGSSCNACAEDSQSDPQRAAIYQYNADGSGGRLFAQGLRNTEGLAFVPGTDTLWVVVNNRDNIVYPLNDSSGNYGKVVPTYVDNHPPDEFIQVRDGGNYGWPFCNPNPDTDSKLTDMPFDLDYELNADGHIDCKTMDVVNKGIQAHSAPLGLTFLQGTQFPTAWQNGAVVGIHGSWNRTEPTGYKVIYFPWVDGKPGDAVDLVTGFVVNGDVWGRPVDTAVAPDGGLYISDDQSGTIYKLSVAA